TERLQALADDLARLAVTVIVATGGLSPAPAAKAARSTIPIVFVLGNDPGEGGLVPSMNRPGGNITGITMISSPLGEKRMEVLHELVAKGADIALLNNPSAPTAKVEERDMTASARLFGHSLHVAYADKPDDLAPAFAKLAELPVSGVMIGPDNLFSNQSSYIAALALRYALPTLGPFREYAVAGNLMSYGASIDDAYRLAGIYAGRILKGEKPADLPVQQPTKIELVINLRTAKALGLKIPDLLAARPAEMME